MEDWSGRKVFAEYASFRLEPESEYYKLRLGRYHGNAGDSFTWHNGKQFTTLDRDHDVYTGRTHTVKPRCRPGQRGRSKPKLLSHSLRRGRSQSPEGRPCCYSLKTHSSAHCPQSPFTKVGQRGINKKGTAKRCTNYTFVGHSGPSLHITSLPEAPGVQATLSTDSGPHTWVIMLALPPTSHVSLGMLLTNLSGPRFHVGK